MPSPSTIAYADCFSGISGDMFLGALLHCGLPEKNLREDLARLDIGDFSLDISPSTTHGIGCLRIRVESKVEQHFRHLSAITAIVANSGLNEQVIATSLAVFRELARAEAKVHDIAIDRVHFHEVGAVDTLIDVVGTVAGLHHLGVARLYASPLPSPRGFVECAHGTLPLPAPAVCEILRGVPCYGVEQQKEMVTPTGAALLKVLASEFGAMPPLTIRSTGYGGGSHVLAGNQPNVLRLIIGTPRQSEEYQEVEVIESHLDDWSPESYPWLCHLLFENGALDVSLAPIQMKKGRPGFQIKIIGPPQLSDALRAILFEHTTTIGLRFRREQRQTLARTTVEVNTPWGMLAAKRVETPGGPRVYPEYEECRRVAEQFAVPLQLVYDTVKNKADCR